MSFITWLRKSGPMRTRRGHNAGTKLTLELLEDRLAPAVVAVSASNPAIVDNSVPGILTSQAVSDDGNLVVYSSTADNVVANDANGQSDIFLYNRATGTTTLISVNSAGTGSSNGNSTSAVISGNGQYVAFMSTATNLAPLGTAAIPEVYVRNLATNTTTLVSQNTAGTVEGNSGSSSPSISDNGLVIAFLGTATNLDPLVTNTFQQVYVRDLTAGTTTLVSKNTAGTVAGNSTSLSPVISGNGQVVAYQTSSDNLDPKDTSPDTDIYAHNLVTNTTFLVSQNTAGVKGDFLSVNPVISASGQFIAFQSNANNLAPQGTSAGVYVRDIVNNTTTLVSQNTAGSGANAVSNAPAISASGQFVAFVSNASNLDPLATSGSQNVFVRDVINNTTTLASKNTAGTAAGNGGSSGPVISADGQYVAFVSTATNLDPIDTDTSQDVYVRDLVNNTTSLVSRNTAGTAKNNQPSNTPVLSANAPFVAFMSSATNLVAGEVNGLTAVYGRDLGSATTALISRHDPGLPGLTGNNGSTLAGKSVSDNGRFVVFTSTANNFDPLNTDNFQEVYVRDLVAGTTTLVSQSTAGVRANNVSSSPVISGNGRYVAFVSTATNLDPLDTDSVQDVYVRDLLLGTTTLVSKNTAGTAKGNQASTNPSISDSGQFVVFTSNSSNLDPLDTGGGGQVFVRDLVNNTTTLVSQNTAGTAAGNGLSFNASISANGQFVVFVSSATNFDPLDTDIIQDVYVRDLINHTTTLVSKNTAGTAKGNGPSSNPVISANGQFIAFVSSSSNLDPLDTGFLNQVFVRDLVHNTTTLVSQNGADTTAANGSCSGLVLSDNGQLIAFVSNASNLDPLDTGSTNQVFVRDLVHNTTTLVSQDSAGTTAANQASGSPVISGSGQFVAFQSGASNLAALDTDTLQDVFVRDLVNHTTMLVSQNSAGTAKGNQGSTGPAISDNGQVIAFQSSATNLVAGDFNNASDVFAVIAPMSLYVDPTFTGPTGSDPATDPGLGLQVGINAFATITAALAAAQPGAVLTIFGGTYGEPSVNINVALSSIDIATNPSDTPVNPTVTIANAVTLSNAADLSLQGVATGTGTSTAANLTFGGTVDGPGGLTVTGSAALTFDGLVGGGTPLAALTTSASSTTFAAAANLVQTSGDQTYNSPVALNASTTTFNLGGTQSSFNDGISGSAANALTKDGPGILTMGGTSGNTYGGLTTVAHGTLILAEPGGPGFRAINGNLQINDGGSVIDAQNDEIADNAAVTMGGTGSIGPEIAVSGSLLTLNAGVTEIIGTLASTSPTSSVVLDDGSTLITGSSGSTTFAGSINGTGALTKAGATTTFTLSGSNDYTGPTVVFGTLMVTGSLGISTSPVSLTDPSSVLNGTGSFLRPVLVTGTASGASISGVTITVVGGIGIDVQPGANNVTVNAVIVTGSSIGILVEPGSGNMSSITNNTITLNSTGLEVLNGCITATGNIIGGASGAGNNVGVYLPAVNPQNATLPVNPLLTLEGNNISWNSMFGMNNASTMGTTAILNWWGNGGGPGAVDGLGDNPIMGVTEDDWAPFALDTTSVGPNPTTFNFFNGTGADGNVYVTGTLGTDTITANVEALNPNTIDVTGGAQGNASYTRGAVAGVPGRIIIYGFGDNVAGAHDTIAVNGSWDAEINTEALMYREPLGFSGTSLARVTTTGTGNDMIFGGGNDAITANTTGNNVLVVGLSTGKTGVPTAPRLSGGSGSNLFIAGYLDCTLAPLAPSGRFDYATLRAMDDAWAGGSGGAADAMTAAALFNVANSPGAILTGSARATILPGHGQSWFVVKGAKNPTNTAGGFDTDYIGGATAAPNYRQAIL